MSTTTEDLHNRGKGLACPSCAVVASSVFNSRPSGSWQCRRRQCLACETRWTTYEIPEDEYRRLKTAEGDLETIVRALRGRLPEGP